MSTPEKADMEAPPPIPKPGLDRHNPLPQRCPRARVSFVACRSDDRIRDDQAASLLYLEIASGSIPLFLMASDARGGEKFDQAFGIFNLL